MKNYTRLALCVPLFLFVTGCADLVVTNVKSEPFTGALAMMKATVKNEGALGAPASTAKVEVKTPAAPSFSQVTTVDTPPLSQGQQIELSVLPFHPIQFAPRGECFEARVCADSADVVLEGAPGEGNNCRVRTFCNK